MKTIRADHAFAALGLAYAAARMQRAGGPLPISVPRRTEGEPPLAGESAPAAPGTAPREQAAQPMGGQE